MGGKKGARVLLNGSIFCVVVDMDPPRKMSGPWKSSASFIATSSEWSLGTHFGTEALRAIRQGHLTIYLGRASLGGAGQT